MRLNLYLTLMLLAFVGRPALAAGGLPGGDSLTLQQCYALARQHAPQAKQRTLLQQSADYTLENAARGYLPQVGIYGQATYQSEVTQVPISVPGQEIPVLSKDQYKLYGEVQQTLYDGGVIHQQRALTKTQRQADQQNVEVTLYALEERINPLFFGVLIIDRQRAQNAILQQDIQAALEKIEAAVRLGTALRSQADILRSELLQAAQQAVELQSTRESYIAMLALFIGQPIAPGVVFAEPPVPTAVATDLYRPELQQFKLQTAVFDVQEKSLAVRNRPRVSLFFQGGLGRPALNMLSNDVRGYYIGGLRLQWQLSGWYTARNDAALIGIARQQLTVQEETFLLQTRVTQARQLADVQKYTALLETDDAIIALRASVKQTAAAQLANGVLDAHDYLREVHAEDQARQARNLHALQGLMAHYVLQTTTGRP
ncbi:TolC family protein [Dawidia soli]|uniref:TolC family protein n=1 Tax=Dawidia soli TaxID=2782352 RepID=A0AAP2DC16_9BACT|nr:TolC family protein [Dawidia soli]MBT1689268.1 TolC family protein [Dawidia soli]